MKKSMWKKMKEQRKNGYHDILIRGSLADSIRSGRCVDCGGQLYLVCESEEIYKGENHIICNDCGWNGQYGIGGGI